MARYIDFATYLANYRARADVAASPELTQAEVYTLAMQEYLKRHEAPLWYEKLGENATGPVYRLGTAIILQDIETHLTALATEGKLKRLNYGNVYSCNPSLRTP